MARGALLTGPPGVGKTTAVKLVIESLSNKGISVSGFYTEERRSGGRRVGFTIVDAAGKGGRAMALVGEGGPRLGRYRVDLDAISWGLELIARAGDVLVIDEVGPMEALHPDFMNAVTDAIKKRPFVLTVHEGLVNEVMRICEGRLFKIDPSNRNNIPPLVVNYIIGVVNYPALTGGASPPHDGDFLLLPGNLLYTPSEKGMHSRGLLSTGSKGSPDPA